MITCSRTGTGARLRILTGKSYARKSPAPWRDRRILTRRSGICWPFSAS